MSDFVNCNKRSITLPPGCKDLIDVLRPHGLNAERLRQRLGTDLSQAVTRDGMIKGTLSDIAEHIERAANSSALVFTLIITPADERLTFSLLRVLEEPLQASIGVESKTPQEAAVRQFLSSHHLQAPADSPTPGGFLPDLPVHLICKVQPLPSDSRVLSRLASDFFQEVGGLTEGSVLSFHHFETAKAA